MSELPASAQMTQHGSMEELYPKIRSILDQGGSVQLSFRGTSMAPTILGGRDEVILSKLDRPPVRGDLPLYRMRDGRFLIHRVIAAEKDGAYTCCGDHRWIPETDVAPEQMLALVTAICRKGKLFSVENRRYRLWVRFWMALFPVRKPLVRFISLCGKTRRLLKRK